MSFVNEAESCPTCPPLYAALVDAHQQLGELRDPDTVVPTWLEERIRSIMRKDPGETPTSRPG